MPACEPLPQMTTSPMRGLDRLVRPFALPQAYIADAEWPPPSLPETPATRYA